MMDTLYLRVGMREMWFAAGNGSRGDEFEVLAMDYSENSILKFISRMNAYLDNINKGAGKPYNIYASCGYSICCINPGMNLNEWLTLSDNRMYAEKEKMRGVRKIIKE
jgi:GGDEF domain-containing protein